MKLFSEISNEIQYVVEAKENGEKDLYIEGHFISGDVKNKNGRYYPMSILRPEVERYRAEMINTGRALGEMSHPSSPSVNLDRVSHRVTKLVESGNGFDGKALITKTPMGNILKGLIESGAKIGVSTRGLGSLKENNGCMEVQKDFRLSAIDAVGDPSGPGCFVNGIMEGVEYFYDPVRGTYKEEKIEELATKVKRLTKEEREAKALVLFETYFDILAEGKL